jgi:hypothetical protein
MWKQKEMMAMRDLRSIRDSGSIIHNSKLLDPKPNAKIQAMTAVVMFEDSMQIDMDEGWFDMASLVAIARCNKQLCALVDRADHLWEPFLAEIKFPQTGFVDDTHWEFPDIPPHNVSDPRIPPRINGGERDDDSFFVHPRDKEARGRGLVLAKQNPWDWHDGLAECWFDPTTGMLHDFFYGEKVVHAYTYIPWTSF